MMGSVLLCGVDLFQFPTFFYVVTCNQINIKYNVLF